MLEFVGTVDDQSETLVTQFLSTLAFLDPTQIEDFIFRGWTTAAPEWTGMFYSEEDVATAELHLLSIDEPNAIRLTDCEVIREQTTDASVPRSFRLWNPTKFGGCIRRLYDLSLLSRISGWNDQIESFHLHSLIPAWIQVKQDANARQVYTFMATGFVRGAFFAHSPLTPRQLCLLRVYVDACVWNDTTFVHPTYHLGVYESTCAGAECFATLSAFPGRYELARKLISLVVETRKR